MKQLIFILFFSTMCFYSNAQETIESNDRTYWINTLTQIADPVVSNMSHGFLRKNMPVETQSGISNPPNVRTTHLEALGRLFVGMAPWLELGPDKTQEGKIREKYINLMIASIDHGFNPKSPDFLNFKITRQPLVDAAFFVKAYYALRSKFGRDFHKKRKKIY